MRKMFIDELPKRGKNQGWIDYKKSIGKSVKFIFDNIEGELKICEYLEKNGLIVEYNNSQYKISKQGFFDCSIGYIILEEKHYNSYKYNDGDKINDIIILEQIRCKNGKSTCKGYKCKCEKCNKIFEISEYDIDNYSCCKEKIKNLCSYCDSDENIHKSSIDNKYYCQKHYQQIYKHGELKIDKEKKVLKYNNNDFCKVEGCNNKSLANYYCHKHYNQLRKYNEILSRTVNDLNEIVTYKDYAEIVLYNKNCEEIARTKIDLDDIEKIKPYKWGTRKTNGLIYTISTINEKIIILGSFLLNKNNGILNYKNKNTLDNRKNNLRIVDRSKNGMNCRIGKNNTSGFTGIFWNKLNKNWVAQIKVNKINIKLGSYKNKDEAIKSRIKGELDYFKEYSKYYESP